MIWIDGKPMPMSNIRIHCGLEQAWFIKQNLKPDSTITYMDVEVADYSPTYESLMSFADLMIVTFKPKK